MLTVLMATHNGTDTLGRTLEQFCALAPPQGGWKLLVVNNASTDRTEELVLGFGDRLPLQYLVEPRLGKPYALNTGLEHVSGDLVVFADDDVLPDPDWLVAWHSAIDRYPEYSIFGGTIDLHYDRDPPAWFSKGWEGILFGPTEPRPEGPIPPNEHNIYGSNMAIRVTALADGARYDERFFMGTLGLMGEEVELVDRLVARGNKTCFIPSARVGHIVQPGQFAWRWMLRRFFRHGKWVALSELQRNGRHVPEIFHVPRWRLRRIMTLTATVPIALLSCDRFRILSHFQRLAFDFGTISQYRSFCLDPKWRDLTLPHAAGSSLVADCASARTTATPPR